MAACLLIRICIGSAYLVVLTLHIIHEFILVQNVKYRQQQ